MKKGKGKIIAIVGAPRSGKSFLSKLLAKHYKGICILEGEGVDFPTRIAEDIAKNIRPLERILWFRNMQIKKYNKALKLAGQGRTVVMDTFWISYQLYIDSLLHDPFEKKIAKDLAAIDKKIMPWPDAIIFLKISEKGIKEFIRIGGREFDQSEEFIAQQAVPVNVMHEKIFSNGVDGQNIITIKRDGLDFMKDKDFKRVVNSIDKT